MRTYSEYKESGIIGIGKIPAIWNVVRLKAVFNEINERYDTFSDATLPLLSVSEYYGVAERAEKIDEDAILIRASSLDGYKKCQEGDFISNIMLAWKCAMGKSRKAGIVSPAYCVYRPKLGFDIAYYHYLLRTQQYGNIYKMNSTGIIESRLRLYTDKFFSLYVPVPSVSEQSAIANYLDEKIAHIDSIISEAKASIEEYKAWKASLIYEAVTKGLDPNAEMKDSGVEWIGKIPSCWERMRIKDCATLMPKVDFSSIKKDDMITFTPMDCIKNGYFENKGSVYSEIEGSYTPYAEGDIVFAKVTPCFENGNAALMENLYSKVGLGSSELFVLRAQNIDPQYLFYFIRNKGFVKAATSTMTGTGGLKRVSSDFIRNCPIPVPSMDEQKKIADYLDRRCKCIDDLISEKESLISDLESYKKSLIFEVVTGKRRVC